MYTMNSTRLCSLLLVSILAIGCNAFKSEAAKREARKRALLDKPWFQDLMHKAEEDLEKVFIAAGFERNNPNVKQDVQSEIKSQLEYLIKFDNDQKAIRVYPSYRMDIQDKTEKGIEKLIRKSQGRFVNVDQNALRNYGDKMEKLAKIMAKAHNNEDLFFYEQRGH